MNSPIPPSPRGPECPPAAVIEALSAGESAPEATRAHVEGCPECSGQLAALTAGRDAFLRARPPERFLNQLDRRAAAAPPSPWRRLLPVLAACVPVLALLVLVPRLLPHESGVTFKGGQFRVVSAREGGEPQPLDNDSTVRAGDALRFAYEATEPGHLLVLELDGRGVASVFHPFGGTASAPLPALQRDFLPGSVVLDDSPGPEWIVAVFSPRPLEAAPLLAQLKEQAGREKPAPTCADCRVTVLRLQKTK